MAPERLRIIRRVAGARAGHARVDSEQKSAETGGTLRVLVMVNPEAGGGAAGRARPHVESLLRKHGVDAVFEESRSTEHLKQIVLSRALGDQFPVLAVLGGDGTFHHVVNAAWSSGLRFALFPAGSGNDIARGLGLPLDPISATSQFLRALHRNERAMDCVHARVGDGSEHIFLAAAGMGLDALAAHLVHGPFRPLPGAVRYVAAALVALQWFKPLDVEATLDGHEPFRFRSAMLAAVANGPVYGSGLCIAPRAQMDDGLLELTLAPRLPLLRVLEALPIVLTTGDLRWPEIRRERARKIRLCAVSTQERVLFHGDGEVLGEAPVTLQVVPGALRMIL